jgi:hypothetical protein
MNMRTPKHTTNWNNRTAQPVITQEDLNEERIQAVRENIVPM